MIGNKYTNITNACISEAHAIRNIKDGWKEIKKSNSFVLSSISYKSNELKLSKIEGTIPANIEKAQKYYFDCLETQKECREMCDKLINIETIDQDNIILFFKTKSKFVVSSREVASIQNRARLNANEILITRNHIDGHPNAPFSKDSVRAESKVYALFLTKINDQLTKVEVFFLFDPKGSIPTSIVNSTTEQQLEAFVMDVQKILKL